jgi:protein-tyrosine sulfotransferase
VSLVAIRRIMRYKAIIDETRFDKLLATRVGDLGIYFRKLLGLKKVPWRKYDTQLPPGFDVKVIENITYTIRGKDYRPAIFIHGVLPRSGTNYLADLFEFHQAIHPHPRHFWEFPLLSVTDRVVELQNDFARVYRRNAEVLQPFEFSAYLNSGFMRYLQELVGPNKTMLFKFPFVHYVSLFRILFPRDYLILLLRDGRDVVSSSMKTFRKGLFKRKFSEYCAEWTCATGTILKHDVNGPRHHPRTLIVKYEELVSNPEGHMREVLDKVGLECDKYDFSGLRDMPVRGSSDLADQANGVHWQPWKPRGKFNPVGRWRDWPEHRKQKFKVIAGDMLINAGYEVSNDW